MSDSFSWRHFLACQEQLVTLHLQIAFSRYYRPPWFEW